MINMENYKVFTLGKMSNDGIEKMINKDTPIDEHTMQLIYDVADGNLGATTIIIKIIDSYSNSVEILKYLKDNGYVGSALWVLYKDVYGEDFGKLMEYLEEQL